MCLFLYHQVLCSRPSSQRRGGGAGEARGGALWQTGRTHGHDECGRGDGLRGRYLRDWVSPRHLPQVLHPQPPHLAVRDWRGIESAVKWLFSNVSKEECKFFFSLDPSFQVIVQNYNSVLTLAHLYQLSDAILVHENDTVHRICSQLLNIKHISFSDVNGVIAQQLGSVLQPALTADSHGVYSRNPLGEGGQDTHTHTRQVSHRASISMKYLIQAKCPHYLAIKSLRSWLSRTDG